MFNVNELIDRALLMLDVKALGEDASYDAITLAKDSLNDILQCWSIDESLNPDTYTVTVDAPVTSSDKPYITVGASDPTNDIPQDIAVLQTVDLQLANIMYNMNEIAYREYVKLSLKNVKAVPRYYAFDYQYPVGKLYFHLLPHDGFKAIITYKPRLATLDSATDDIDMPDWWKPAMLWNLINELSQYFPSVDATGAGGASKDAIYKSRHYLDVIRRRNAKMNIVKVRPGYCTNNANRTGGIWTSPYNRFM